MSFSALGSSETVLPGPEEADVTQPSVPGRQDSHPEPGYYRPDDGRLETRGPH